MFRLWVAVATLVGCSSIPNPRSCVDGTCLNPEFPFCDVNGTLGGIELECIAVSCEPASFAECRGSSSVVCNGTGDDYVIEQCERGCAAAGCRLCEPNETACTNDKVARCDADGIVSVIETCGFGCADDGPRCLDLVASNSLDDVLVPSAFDVDLDLSGTVVIHVDDGTIDGAPPVPSFLIPAPASGPAIRVFFGRTIQLGDVTVIAQTATSPAVAFRARDEILVDGTVTISSAKFAPGAMYNPECAGGPYAYAANPFSAQASGGGGNATPGGAGGLVDPSYNVPPEASVAGGVSGNDEIVPLRGGCGLQGFTAGGGAIQLSAGKRIRVMDIIDVRGAAGRRTPQSGNEVPLGGGAGGGILLESSVVELAATARLLATGGSGASREADGVQSINASPAPGAACNLPNCGRGGDGASPTTSAQSGGNAMDTSQSAYTGGGGGGLGRVRINTRNGMMPASTALIAARVTYGFAITR